MLLMMGVTPPANVQTLPHIQARRFKRSLSSFNISRQMLRRPRWETGERDDGKHWGKLGKMHG
ncbi:MAG: hypothetical protein K0S79_1759 [Nitrospira sp.]|nr:hypothetical protein [Nitrospira sp.]